MECISKLGKNKKQYDSLEDAIKAAKIMNSKPQQISKLVAYKCKKCCKYHIGRNGKFLKNKENIFLQ